MTTSPLYDKRLLTWRQQLNPLVGLNMGRIVMALSNSEMGFKADIQWLYKFIERRDAVLKAVIERRSAKMKKLDYTVKIKKGKEGKQAEAQQEALQEFYDRINNMKAAVEHLGMSSFRGYAHLEKHYDEDGNVDHLEPVPQYLWCHKLPSREWLYNAKAFQTATGVPIDLDNFVIRENDRPADEIALIFFMRKSLSLNDWDGLVETYGIPPLFIKLPQGIGTGVVPGQPGSEILTFYQQMAEQVISDARGVLPFGAEIELPTKGAETNQPFETHLGYMDQQIVLAGTSGLLTTLTAPTGMNDKQGEEHGDAFADLAKAEALEISEVFQNQIDSAFLDENFKGQERMVYFELEYQNVDEDDPIDDAQKLSTAGYLIDVDELSEETGYTLTLKPQPGSMSGSSYSGSSAGGGGGSDQYSDWTGDQVYNRIRPVSDKIQNVLSADDRMLMNRLAELEKDLGIK